MSKRKARSVDGRQLFKPLRTLLNLLDSLFEHWPSKLLGIVQIIIQTDCATSDTWENENLLRQWRKLNRAPVLAEDEDDEPMLCNMKSINLRELNIIKKKKWWNEIQMYQIINLNKREEKSCKKHKGWLKSSFLLGWKQSEGWHTWNCYHDKSCWHRLSSRHFHSSSLRSLWALEGEANVRK